jgi:nucleoside-diphosphate-sugar epimerase
VLLVGGTGRTGRRVLSQLVSRGIGVRAIVRSSRGVPAGASGSPGVEVVEASLLSLSGDELRHHLRGCSAVISCLGHVLSVRGVLGPPRDLVTRATTRLCRAIEAARPASPVKLVLMSSVSVQQPGTVDARRGAFERAFLWLLRGLLPPARDNQQAADFLRQAIGTGHPFVQWVVVRPDTLLEGETSGYGLHAGLVNSLFAPGRTTMANVAHFMCELVTEPGDWEEWKGRMPVIVDETGAMAPARPGATSQARPSPAEP